MKKTLKKLFWMVFNVVILYIVAVVISSYLNTGTISLTPEYFTDSLTMSIFGIATLFCIVLWLNKWVEKPPAKKDPKMTAGKGKDTAGKDQEQYYDKHFMSDKEMESEKSMNFCNLKTIRDKKDPGILLRVQRKGKDVDINFIKPIHTLVLGTTSQGKSTQYFMPFLHIMSRVKNKPSFIVSDPKDELRINAYNELKKEGYDILQFNLDQPYASIKWNPMEMSYSKYHQALRIEELIKSHSSGDKPADRILISESFDYTVSNWYEFNGRAYVNQQLLFADLTVRKKELMDEAINELNDFCLTICPTLDKNQPTWEDGARNFITGVAQAMLEDSADSRLKMTKEKFNPYNLAQICKHRDSTGRDQFATLKKYFANRDKFSQAPGLAYTVLNAHEQTARSYLSTLDTKLGLFNDKGVCLLTSSSEIDFKSLVKKPTALFLRIPDHIQTRHPIAVICFSQLYKALVETAYDYNPVEPKLPRDAYFILDEFANLPKFQNFGTTISVARSRGIYYIIALQSYAQLDSKYGKEDSSVIYDNLPITVYVGTSDMDTNEKFSKQLGSRTIELTKKQETKGKEDKGGSTSTNVEAISIPLIDPQKLPTINRINGQDGENKLIVNYGQFKHPVQAVFTPIYNMKDIFDCSAPILPYQQIRDFKEEEIYYDIKERNQLIESASKKASDDDDFDFFN